MVAQPDHRITRDAFLYMEPKGSGKDFAQCGTCEMFYSRQGKCAIHGPKVMVEPGSSCGFYIPGTPSPTGTAKTVVTPEESGLVTRPVRCENCRYFDRTCGLYERLNKSLSALFDLDPKVHPKACCNAQEPKRASVAGRPIVSPRRGAAEKAVGVARRMAEKVG